MLNNKKAKKDITEDEKMIAEKLNDAISKAEEADKENETDEELTPVEQVQDKDA